MIKDKNVWINRANFAALCGWLIASIFMATTAYLWHGQDFRGYYAAAKVLLLGGNPYDYNQVSKVLLDATGEIRNNPYYYSPWFAWLITPFALLPFELARCIWMIFNWTIWTLGLWKLGKIIDWPKPGWRRWLLNILMTIVFAWITWRYGQTGILLFAIAVAALASLNKQNWLQGGLWLALLLFKPNITLLPVLVISLWFIRRGIWRPVVVLLSSSIVMLIASIIPIQDWYQYFLDPDFSQGLFFVQDGPESIIGTRINTTIFDWLTMLQVDELVVQIIYALIVVIAVVVLYVLIRRSNSIFQVIVISCLVNFTVTPYALQYDYPLLTLVFFWAIALYSQSTSSMTKSVGVIISLLITSVIFWENPISDGYWIIVGLVVLTIWVLWNQKRLRIPANLF